MSKVKGYVARDKDNALLNYAKRELENANGDTAVSKKQSIIECTNMV